MGGRYEEGRDQFLRGRAGDMDTAITALESVVSQDPTYKLSLMYFGRAYYRKGRYQDAFAVLQRALAVNPNLHSVARSIEAAEKLLARRGRLRT